MGFEVDLTLPPDVITAAWDLYQRAFDELRTVAVQRHLLYHDEFDQVMADERVWKYRGIDLASPGRVTALATFTNALESMPLISPDYFAHRWPALFDSGRIWYIGFFAIDPDYRGTGIFEQVISHMWDQVRHSRGIALLDVCRRNDAFGLPSAIHRTLRAITRDMRASPIDEQTYWLYEPLSG